MILRCFALICLFVQFKNLKIIQSKLILSTERRPQFQRF